MTRLRRQAVVALLLAACSGSPPPAASPEPPTVDRFDRDVRGSWGMGALGAWSVETIEGGPLGLRVRGGAAVVAVPDGRHDVAAVVGAPRNAEVTIAATFTTDATGGRWHVVLRRSGLDTFYAVRLRPAADGATLEVVSSKAGRVTNPAEAMLPFVVRTDAPYRIEARVHDEETAVVIEGRAWPVGEQPPTRWQVRFRDLEGDRLFDGRFGVGLTVPAGPATMTVDDVTIWSG